VNYLKQEQERIDQDIALIRQAITKPWNNPGELSSVLATQALDRIAYKIGATKEKK
jgi:hypothetical protein